MPLAEAVEYRALSFMCCSRRARCVKTADDSAWIATPLRLRRGKMDAARAAIVSLEAFSYKKADFCAALSQNGPGARADFGRTFQMPYTIV